MSYRQFRLGGLLMALGALALLASLFLATGGDVNAVGSALIWLLLVGGLALLWAGWRLQKRHGRIDAR